jgi:hypothetical protein
MERDKAMKGFLGSSVMVSPGRSVCMRHACQTALRQKKKIHRDTTWYSRDHNRQSALICMNFFRLPGDNGCLMNLHIMKTRQCLFINNS